ncbi:MAG: rRNA maturation RNase YbeY [Actinobacteria bacterium]|nr:rRNA maturation RNase YbeY [Actinomycetota bacterium]MCL6087822.1 rRNA maturation RNase YbeY [Actinomycetota bacterium]
MDVIVINNQKDFDVEANEIIKISDYLFKKLEREESSELNIVFIGKEEMRDINKKYRNIDKETDVLSFSYLNDKNVFGFIDDAESFKDEYGFFTIGEILICPSVASENIKIYKKNWSLTKELIFLIIHGMLHIYGYDHEKAEEKLLMEKKQESLLSEVEKQFKI